MHVYEVLLRPVITEKTGQQSDRHNQYTFEVDTRANKIQIKDAVETAFKVNVVNVNVITIPARMGHYGRRVITKRAAFKKAIVTLAPGDKIQLFEGV